MGDIQRQPDGQISNEVFDQLAKDLANLETEIQKNAAAPAAAAPTLTLVPDPAPVAPEPVAAAPAAAAPAEEMQEFHAPSGEASLEETLAGMKEEAPASGKSLLDEGAPAVESEPVAAVEAEEVADEPSAEELEEAIRAEVDQELGKSQKSPTLPAGNGAEGVLAMKLSGRMKLSLSYDFGDQSVQVSFDDDALRVELADGTEFKIPVRQASKQRKVA